MKRALSPLSAAMRSSGSPLCALSVVVVVVHTLTCVLVGGPHGAHGQPLDAVSMLREFVSIESTSNYENPMSDVIGEWLRVRNWTIEIQEVAHPSDPDAEMRRNVLAYRGERKFRMLINSHLDTVPPFIPFSEDATTLYGRGTTDAKAQIVTQLIAVTELFEAGLLSEDDVGFLYVVGEETAGDGMMAANDLGLEPEFLLVGEPTEDLLATGHKSPMRVMLESEGLAAHSAYPELGQSAISPLLRVLTALEDEEWPVSNVLGPTTMNIGQIDGGVAANVVPASASAFLMFRVSTNTKDVLAQAQRIVDQYGNGQVKLTLPVVPDEPMFTDVVPGFETGFMSYGTDLPRFKYEPRKNYLMGCGSILVAHSDDEAISRADLLNFTDRLKRLILAILSQ